MFGKLCNLNRSVNVRIDSFEKPTKLRTKKGD